MERLKISFTTLYDCEAVTGSAEGAVEDCVAILPYLVRQNRKEVSTGDNSTLASIFAVGVISVGVLLIISIRRKSSHF